MMRHIGLQEAKVREGPSRAGVLKKGSMEKCVS